MKEKLLHSLGRRLRRGKWGDCKAGLRNLGEDTLRKASRERLTREDRPDSMNEKAFFSSDSEETNDARTCEDIPL